MSIAVELPALGESIVEGTIARWLVKEGESVQRDQPLVEVTTDKVDTEIPAPAAGVVEEILVAEGETVEVGAVLVRIDGKAAKRPRSEAQPSEGGPPQGKAAKQAGRRPARSEAPRPEAEPRATPVARRVAEVAGVDLGAVEGTGPSGRVTRSDVEKHAAEPQRPRTAAPAPKSAPGARRPAYLDYLLQPGDRVIPMSPLRRLVAEHMVISKRVSPHVGTVAEIDFSGVVQVRAAHKRSFEAAHGFGLTYLPFVVHAAVRAVREFPRLNASVLEDSVVEKKDVHVGIAVETEKGLVVPVVRNADRLSLVGLAEAVEDLSTRARTKKLSPDDLQGGTFTISNPGRHGNLYGFAIINQPQVGILRMGEIVKRPVVRSVDGGDAIAIRPIMHLALSYDHRAVDGAPANAFLFWVRQLLEEAEFDL